MQIVAIEKVQAAYHAARQSGLDEDRAVDAVSCELGISAASVAEAIWNSPEIPEGFDPERERESFAYQQERTY